MKKAFSLLTIFTFYLLTIGSVFMTQAQTIAVFETTIGTFKIKLYDETPLHKENFVKLVQSGYYDSIIFHRVIQGFMIQTGDPNSRKAQPGQPLGDGGPGYTIPAEFNQNLFHKKGAVAAARLGDQVNPSKSSSGSQFYIVQGQVLTSSQLNSLSQSGRHQPFTDGEIKAYTTTGGTPHLDNSYTVFGEVIEGINVIDKIASAETDQRNRPLIDMRIIKAFLQE
ncbi:MAG TPA: peptidylprolyl isomerase [Bacteroidales bacterium]|jgi:peptidyl-prolyl cis-trans isomerase B (cyclophilin B)|nr:peptidylprolyl isomerase [Bacteroidales bacterium]